MFLKKISLTNFRNYSKCEFEFETSLTVLVGNNAQGKSNFLEAIYFLATTKSNKADKDEELVKRGEIVTRVQGIVEREGEDIGLEIAMLLKDKVLAKRVKVNGIARRVLDYIGNLSVVAFSPEDINLVAGPPSLRRWHIDLTLAQIDREYKKALTDYEEVVKRKNRLLKGIREGFAKIEELNYWKEQQVHLGGLISKKREDFFKFLNTSERKFGEFEFEYLKSEISKERLEEYLNREIAAAASLIGPHRDDFRFLIKEKKGSFVDTQDDLARDLSRFGSRGEQRVSVLDLKISEVEFVEEVLKNRPVLLLDDVFSELDLKHREHVIDLIGLQQTIITAVELDPYLEVALADATTLVVENGKLSEIAEK